MPFKSKKQARWMFATHPKMAKRWADHTDDIKSLPESDFSSMKEEQAVRGLLARISRRLQHELSELEESLSIADQATKDRFIRHRIKNIRMMVNDERQAAGMGNMEESADQPRDLDDDYPVPSVFDFFGMKGGTQG